MKLYAAGFNAWNQLALSADSPSDGEPQDVFTFRHVLGDDQQILGLPVSRLTYTIVTQGSGVCKAGSGYPQDGEGLQAALASAENALGESLTATHGNGQLHKYPSPDEVATGSRQEEQTWPCPSPVKQMAAWDAGWVVLYEDGSVATMGDGRFEDCLGREVTSDTPADAPCVVPDLRDLGEPIRRIAAGGYTAAALTQSGSLYAWGMPSPGTHRRQQAIPDLSGVPNYIAVSPGGPDDDCDVNDVALGESHAIVLTQDGGIYVIGSNENGQLGLGMAPNQRAAVWTKVELQLAQGQRPVRVAAGPRTSFILVQ